MTDVKLFILSALYMHDEGPHARATELFADFSFAFNITKPNILEQRLVSNFDLRNDLVAWIMNIIASSLRKVLVNEKFSEWPL